MYSTCLFSGSMKLTQFSDSGTKENIREQELRPQRTHRRFSSQSIQTISGAHTPHLFITTGTLQGKAPGARNCTSLSPFVFTAWFLIKHRNNFTFFLRLIMVPSNEPRTVQPN
jgi:hypothetical protein